MTDTQTRPAASSGSPGAGTPASTEKKAGMLAMLGGFLMGGPLGLVLMAAAVGIQQAFAKAGWDQPGWLGGDRPGRLTPEQVQARHAAAVAESRRWVAEARARAARRRADWAEHRRRMADWVDGGRSGDRPLRPARRGFGEFLGNSLRASKSWYTLLDDKLARGNEKVNNFYGRTGDFFRSLWGFTTGFLEGFKRGWNEQRNPAEPNAGDDDWDRADDEEPTGQAGPDSTTEHEPEPAPQPELDDEDGEREPIKVEASVGEPTEEPGVEPDELTSGPAGPDEAGKGEEMATDTAQVAVPAAAAAPGGPQGPTNLDMLFQEFQPVGPQLVRVDEQVDSLNAERPIIAARVARIAALAARYGAPGIVYQIMAEATRTAEALAAGVVEVSVQNATAQDLVIKALEGLRPAEVNQADLHTADARGDVLDRVGS